MRETDFASGDTSSLHDWESVRTELLFIHDSVIPAGKADRSGEREREFSAWLVREGRAQIASDGETARAGKGQWLVCFGSRVTQRFAPDTRLLALRVSQSWPDGSPLFEGKALVVIDAREHPSLERHARRLLALTEKLRWNDDYERDMRTVFHWRNQMSYPRFLEYQRHWQAWQGALVEALMEAGLKMRIPESTDPRVARALQVIDSQTPGGGYPEEAVTRASGLSTGRLNRVCAQIYGFTLHQYWERGRMERARRALKAGKQSVKQVAYELGFRQLSHFSAWFKRHEGASPRAFQTQEARERPGRLRRGREKDLRSRRGLTRRIAAAILLLHEADRVGKGRSERRAASASEARLGAQGPAGGGEFLFEREREFPAAFDIGKDCIQPIDTG